MLTRKQVAEKIGVDVKTVSAYVKQGDLTAKYFSPRTIRFNEEDVEEFISTRKGMAGNSSVEEAGSATAPLAPIYELAPD